MRIKVLYLVEGTVKVDEFTCAYASRQIFPGTTAGTLDLKEGQDTSGRKVTFVQYTHVQAIYTYED